MLFIQRFVKIVSRMNWFSSRKLRMTEVSRNSCLSQIHFSTKMLFIQRFVKIVSRMNWFSSRKLRMTEVSRNSCLSQIHWMPLILWGVTSQGMTFFVLFFSCSQTSAPFTLSESKKIKEQAEKNSNTKNIFAFACCECTLRRILSIYSYARCKIAESRTNLCSLPQFKIFIQDVQWISISVMYYVDDVTDTQNTGLFLSNNHHKLYIVFTYQRIYHPKTAFNIHAIFSQAMLNT